jgi:hypothetical protein
LRRGLSNLADEQQLSFAERHGITLQGKLNGIDTTPVRIGNPRSQDVWELC